MSCAAASLFCDAFVMEKACAPAQPVWTSPAPIGPRTIPSLPATSGQVSGFCALP